MLVRVVHCTFAQAETSRWPTVPLGQYSSLLASVTAPASASVHCDDHVHEENVVAVVFVHTNTARPAADPALTVTFADRAMLPPEPEQVSVYVADCDNAPVDCVPESVWVPDQAPDAVHVLAFVLDQVSTALLPELIDTGLTDKLRVGAGGAVTATVADLLIDPPVPEQLSV
jgi:hypothetical protein